MDREEWREAFKEMEFRFRLNSFTVEYAGCSSHEIEITTQITRQDLQRLRNAANELLGEGS